jgi:hypothetical protein
MKRLKLLKNIFALFLLILLLSCAGKNQKDIVRKVFVKETNGKYVLYKNGNIFSIKGASGYTNLAELSRCGGNTIRVWDTAHIDKVLKDANKNGISVIIGFPLPESQFIEYYNDTAKVAIEFKKLKRLVNRLKSDPAVLMWCVGNELVFPYKPSYNNFYKAFNDIVKMIHTDDPDHPVTTTMVNFQRKEIFNIKSRTDVDIISFNIFSMLNIFRSDLDNFRWFWKGPYLITEWGIDGPWIATPHTAWNAKIEPNSTQKANSYLYRYQKDMPIDDPRFLGSFIFFWGQKQEITHTWYSMFDENGNKTESVYISEQIWTGKKPYYNVPAIKDMLLSGKHPADNIIYEPNKPNTAEIFLHKKIDSVKIVWEIYPEDWFKKNNVNNLKRPPLLKGLIINQIGLKVNFKTPAKDGPYRIFATVFDQKGNIATSNVPFYVIDANGKN